MIDFGKDGWVGNTEAKVLFPSLSVGLRVGSDQSQAVSPSFLQFSRFPKPLILSPSCGSRPWFSTVARPGLLHQASLVSINPALSAVVVSPLKSPWPMARVTCVSCWDNGKCSSCRFYQTAWDAIPQNTQKCTQFSITHTPNRNEHLTSQSFICVFGNVFTVFQRHMHSVLFSLKPGSRKQAKCFQILLIWERLGLHENTGILRAPGAGQSKGYSWGILNSQWVCQPQK